MLKLRSLIESSSKARLTTCNNSVSTSLNTK